MAVRPQTRIAAIQIKGAVFLDDAGPGEDRRESSRHRNPRAESARLERVPDHRAVVAHHVPDTPHRLLRRGPSVEDPDAESQCP